MGGLGAFYQAKSLGLSEGAATSAMLQAQNREREGREQEAKTQELLEEQNKLLRNQQNAAADAQQSAKDSAAREKRDAIAAEEERGRKAQWKKEYAEKKAVNDRRAQIAKDLFASLEKLFESTKAQHPGIEEASGSLQDLAALNTSRDDSGSAINADLWVKAWQLEKLIELIEPLEDSLSEADQLEKFNTLKEKIPVFISSHAELGTIPAKPLAFLKRERFKLDCIHAVGS